MRILVLSLGLALAPALGAQTAVLDTQRWSELREELIYEPTDEPADEPTEEEPDRDIELGPLAKYLLIGVLGFGVLGLLYFVLRDSWRKREQAEPTEPIVRPEELDEDRLTLQQADALITRAEANGQWNIAIRLHFLALLKDLQEQGRITWRRDKTNRDYRYDLAGAPDEAAFAELVTAYESVWYGDHLPSESGYRQLAMAFTRFRGTSRYSTSSIVRP